MRGALMHITTARPVRTPAVRAGTGLAQIRDMSQPIRRSPLDDDTVRTILDRARRRARTVSQRCTKMVRPGLRPPAPGPVDRVDPKKLEGILEPPKDAEREDAFEQGLAASIRIDRST